MIITFTPNGEAQAMHRDELDLGFLGPREIERASEIKFNAATQRWEIQLPVKEDLLDLGGVVEGVVTGYVCQSDFAKGFHTYDGARKIEVQWLDACRLEGVEPESYNGIAALKFLRSVNSPDL